jgi:hypothetical protein
MDGALLIGWYLIAPNTEWAFTFLPSGVQFAAADA